MNTTSPPVAFHFVVSFSKAGPKVSDTAFQEVSGLEHGLDTELVVEGGENRFVHQLPKPAKAPNLTLKRCLTDKTSGLVKWCQETLERDLAKRIEPKDMQLSLLDADQEPVASWAVTNAYPVKWTIGAFDAMKNQLAIETIELAYQTIKRKV